MPHSLQLGIDRNRRFKLASRPVGTPTRDTWSFVTEPVTEPETGEVLVRSLFLSLDPAMRGWMNDEKSYLPPVGIGEVMRATGIGKVVSSLDPDFAVGDVVRGRLNVQDYAVLKGKDLTKLDTTLAPLPLYLSALGMPGMTAYFGLIEIGQPKAGETVVVSGAAGAVGVLVGQIAKLLGCRAIGIAGGAEKCVYAVKEMGLDACIDYKAGEVQGQLRQHCPDGIDVYFDNVGGDILDACLANLARHARVVICGAISQYNSATGVKGPDNYMSLLVNRARMEGFVVFDFAARYGEAVQRMGDWLRKGELKSREDIVEGLETFPETLLRLFTGENFGKLILKVADS